MQNGGRKRLTASDVARLKPQAIALRREGNPIDEIARRLGVGHSTAAAWVEFVTEAKSRLFLARREADLGLCVLSLMRQPGDSFTLQEIAVMMNMTRERVRQIEAGALKKLCKRFRATMPSGRTHSISDLLETLLGSGPARGRTGALSK